MRHSCVHIKRVRKDGFIPKVRGMSRKRILKALGYGSTYLAGQIVAGFTLGTAVSLYIGYKVTQLGITDKDQMTQMITSAQEIVSGPMVAFGALITIIFLLVFSKSEGEASRENQI